MGEFRTVDAVARHRDEYPVLGYVTGIEMDAGHRRPQRARFQRAGAPDARTVEQDIEPHSRARAYGGAFSDHRHGPIAPAAPAGGE